MDRFFLSISGHRFHHPLILLSLVLALSAFVYLPGISGPWIFDDYTNLIHNSYVKVQTLSTDAFYQAAYSLKAGPLQRPISMISFALNHYFAGGMNSTTPYKITNLVIHIINGLLVFWLLRLVFMRLAQVTPHSTFSWSKAPQTVVLVAGAAAMLWLIHPIQITSVLYVVQRMTELSALFTFLGLITYLKGRSRVIHGEKGGVLLVFAGPVLFGLFGILCKENAALLPVFMLVLELTLYANETPWDSWSKLSLGTRRALIASTLVVTALLLLWAIHYALPNYKGRDFTMPERIMTEARVLFFYISLILLPQINRFGHQHDDIAISTSLFTPWTTLPSLLGLAVLFILAILGHRKYPLFSLGMLWFFAGHLMESTLFPLEIAHEHRNYIPSLGIILVVIHLINHGCHKLGHRKLWLAMPALIVFMGGATYVRAEQWSSYNTFYRYEAAHHPDSARTQSGLSLLLEAQGNYSAAMDASRRAAELEQNDAGFMMDVYLLAARQGIALGEAEQKETLRRLASSPITATTIFTFDRVSVCLQTWCKSLQVPVETWLKTLLQRTDTTDKSFFYYQLGRVTTISGRFREAVEFFRLSYQADPEYLHPLFEQANIYIHLGDKENAAQVLSLLRKANAKTPYHRDREVEELANVIAKMGKTGVNSSAIAPPVADSSVTKVP